MNPIVSRNLREVAKTAAIGSSMVGALAAASFTTRDKMPEAKPHDPEVVVRSLESAHSNLDEISSGLTGGRGGFSPEVYSTLSTRGDSAQELRKELPKVKEAYGKLGANIQNLERALRASSSSDVAK